MTLNHLPQIRDAMRDPLNWYGVTWDGRDVLVLIEIAEAVMEWNESERAVAVESLPYLGLGPDDVFDRRDAALRRLRTLIHTQGVEP